MRNLKKFATTTEMEQWSKKYDLVSYIEDIDSVIIENAKPYFTIIPKEDSKLIFSSFETESGIYITDHIYYSINDGKTWGTLTASGTKETNIIPANTPILLKGNIQSVSIDESGFVGGSIYFNLKKESVVDDNIVWTNAEFDVEGYITSLIFGDNYASYDTLSGNTFAELFQDCKVINANKLILPSDTSLGCYYKMFFNCDSLISAPVLPATILNEYCYQSMFNGCTSLTTAPELPATTLARVCYGDMFYGCSNLTTAPQLLATTLVQRCYHNMFRNCSKLNYIKAMFTTTPGTTYTQSWVYNVAASGTFVKNSAAQWSVSGADGIPNGWTVETASA